MALTRAGRLAIVIVLLLSTVGAMTLSVKPETQHSVDEVMAEPDSFADGRIHLRGVIANGSHDSDESTFLLIGSGASLRVSLGSIAVPEGFEEGRTVAVKGDLVTDGQGWILKAHEVKTGCPSKYEAE